MKSMNECKKKLWFMGRVYDLAATPIPVIEMNIEARLLDYTGVKMSVRIKELSENELEVNLVRNVREEMKLDYILAQDEWLITGEGYKGFTPRYCLPGIGCIVPNAIVYDYLDDFISIYKRNAVFYGRKRSRVKDVFIDCQPTSLYMILRYG